MSTVKQGVEGMRYWTSRLPSTTRIATNMSASVDDGDIHRVAQKWPASSRGSSRGSEVNTARSKSSPVEVSCKKGLDVSALDGYSEAISRLLLGAEQIKANECTGR